MIKAIARPSDIAARLSASGREAATGVLTRPVASDGDDGTGGNQAGGNNCRAVPVAVIVGGNPAPALAHRTSVEIDGRAWTVAIAPASGGLLLAQVIDLPPVIVCGRSYRDVERRLGEATRMFLNACKEVGAA